ncbi:MAG: LD-carboxypeptidase [Bacteroidales bacterium]|nr:LD-carboxypeptidase [Bacteroidales bacterium]
MHFKQLKRKDKIGLITPAGFITKQKLKNAVQNIENLGFEAFWYGSVSDKKGYLAGTDKARIEELHKMYKNNSVKAILCVRGGYGATRILDLIDYELIKQNPKPLIGYSDITALHSAIYKKTGQIGFHGTVGASIFTEFTLKNFKEVFCEKKEVVNYTSSETSNYKHYTIHEGKASGKLAGGNLSLINSLLCTPYDVNWDNKIVFIEEINEPPYKIDRLLTQLIQAGKFKKVKGIIFGIFNRCEGKDFNVKNEDTFSLKEILSEKIKPLKIPAAYGFPFGHIKNQIILPIGANADFDTNKMQLKIKKDFFR